MAGTERMGNRRAGPRHDLRRNPLAAGHVSARRRWRARDRRIQRPGYSAAP
jgi:hypothetical protein